MPTHFFFNFVLELLEVWEHFVTHWKDPIQRLRNNGIHWTLSFALVPKNQNELHPRGLFSCFSLLEMGTNVLPNWHAAHTPSIPFSLKVGSVMTIPFDCIPLSLWRLMWLILLCHNSVSMWTLRSFVNMTDFISFKSRMNIRPSLCPLAMSRPPFLMNEP